MPQSLYASSMVTQSQISYNFPKLCLFGEEKSNFSTHPNFIFFSFCPKFIFPQNFGLIKNSLKNETMSNK